LGRIVHISLPDGFEDRWNRFKTLAEEYGGISKCIREAIELWLSHIGEEPLVEVVTPEMPIQEQPKATSSYDKVPEDQCDCPYCDYISTVLGFRRHPKGCTCPECSKYRQLIGGEEQK
jgi:hypothetical protein